jgi:hypothetical protein
MVQSNPITSLDRPWWFHEIGAPQISRQPTHNCGKVVSPKPPATSIHQKIFLVLISVGVWVDLSATVRMEGLCQLKNPATVYGKHIDFNKEL